MNTARIPGAFGAFVLALSLGACAATGPEPDLFETLGNDLSRSQRRDRALRIREVARTHGLTNGWLLASIADAETNLAHCWSEATWACQGPISTDCGGPVIAGAGDGPCYLREGGLGMFQFDGGTHDATLRRDGSGILRIDGSIERAVGFVADMVVRSQFVDIDTRAEALAWMNGLRPGGPGYHEWIQTVTGYYNGCLPGRCSVYEVRYARYDQVHRALVTELGEDVLFDDEPAPAPAPVAPGREWTHPTDPVSWHKDFNVVNPGLGGTSGCFGVPMSTLVHAGEDLGRPAGTEVRAIGEGEVVFAGWFNYPGNVIVIEHALTVSERAAVGLDGDRIYSMYGHVTAPLVRVGDSVTAGQRIATIWSWPGNSHLHWEIRTFASAPICGGSMPGPGYTGPGTDATDYGYLDPEETLARLSSAGGDATCDNGVPVGGTACAAGDLASEYVCARPELGSTEEWDARPCAAGYACQGDACAPIDAPIEEPSCGDGVCDDGEGCSTCEADCGACAPVCGDGVCDGGEGCSTCESDCGACEPVCGVSGHLGSGENGSACSQPEAWRCAYSAVQGAWTSQVCRSGRWLIYRRNPTDCASCCGSYSAGCGP